MQKTFPAHGPASVYVEIGSGLVRVDATDIAETAVHVDGDGADDTTVELRGDQVVVIGPPRRVGFLSFGSDLTVTVTLPTGSDLTTRLGSADLVATGRLGGGRLKSGSGQVQAEAFTDDTVIQTGSGDVEVGSAEGHLRVKTGSGSVHVGRVAGPTALVTGSGRISVDTAVDQTVTKTGSGDVRIGQTSTDVSLRSGSGDLDIGSATRGVLKAKTASGSVQVGVPAGIPVWTDITSVSGDLRSNLQGAGQPGPGQDHLEIRATTVSGDVTLIQL